MSETASDQDTEKETTRQRKREKGKNNPPLSVKPGNLFFLPDSESLTILVYVVLKQNAKEKERERERERHTHTNRLRWIERES